MKNILIIFFLFLCYSVVAQNNPSGVPTQFSTGWFRHGWDQSDSGKIFTNRAPNFTPRFPGTVEFYQDAGVDSLLHLWTGGRWLKLIPGFDSTSLSNRINVKLNISDTAAMLLPYLRKADTTNKWVQDMYVRNDSLFKFKNGTETFLDTLGGGGGGSGTVTSVGLSLPSAFNVTPSTITTSGTFDVTAVGTALEYIRGNGTLATTDTGMIPNFHLKARSLLTGTSPITFNQTTGAIGINNANASGAKGAATFNSGSFADNGNGLISLSQPVPPGSCINCDITWGIDGRPTSYASGTPPRFVNAPGAGDTLSILDTLKRLNAGFGINNIVTNYNITHEVDTNEIATQYDLTQLQGVSLNNIGAGLRWLATSSGNYKTVSSSNTILWDSTSNVNALTAKADTSVLATQFDISQLPSGNGVANQITYWTGVSTIGGDAGMIVRPSTNTIVSDSSNVKRVDVRGDSTYSDKIVFLPSKTKEGSSAAMIGYGEANNEYDNDTTVNNTLEFKIGPRDGAAGAYIRLGLEKRWRPFFGATYHWMEAHLPEIRLVNGQVYRPASWTGAETGEDGTWTHRANLHSFYDWDGGNNLGGFSRGAGEFIAYHNFSGNGVTEMSIRDTGTAVRAAGIRINGQIGGGERVNSTDIYGQAINWYWETAPIFRAGDPGTHSSNWNYVFNIADTNTGHAMIVTKGAGAFDNVYFWIHNDGRTVSGDAGFFFPGYKFQAKSQGSNAAFIAGDYDANSNTVIYPATFGHAMTSGNMGANGIGAGFKFKADDNVNELTDIGSMEGILTDVTNGSEDGDVVFRAIRAGVLNEVGRYKSTGQYQLATYTTSNFIVADSTTYKPAVFDANGNLYRMAGWPAGGSAATTLYTGDGTITGGNRTVSTGGFTTTWTGSNDNETSFSVLNTGTTNASAIAGTANGTTSIGVSGTSPSYLGVYGTSTSNTGVQGESSSGNGVVGVSSTGAAFRGQINPSANNAIANVASLLVTTSSGAGANGLGGAIQYELETGTSGTSQIAGSIAFKWTDATNATRTSQLELFGVNSTVTARKAALAGTGQWTWDGYGAGTFSVTPATTPVYSASGVVGERIAPKIYTALISATAGNDPTVTVLGTNEVGSVVWTRNSSGNYTGTLSGAFTANKTWVVIQRGSGTTGFINGWIFNSSANTINIQTFDNVGNSVDSFDNIAFEVRVYP